MIKTISRTQDTIIVVDDTGVPRTARSDHPKWTELNQLISQISYVPDDLGGNGVFLGPVAELVSTMDLKTAIETYTVGDLSVNALGVTYKGRPLHTIDVERLMAFMREKLDYRAIANYIVRKMQNPSARAIKEMYNFLENRGMPLTLKGTFIAYKGVNPEGWSITGNKETVVLQGEVDAEGHIKNTIGATIEVERSSVDDDFREGCSTGLHVGSLEYARGFGKKIIYVEVDPADVVSVPLDCNCQKLRCCKYTVVGECSGQLPNTYTNEFDSKPANKCPDCGEYAGECACHSGIEDETCEECGEDIDECICGEEAETAELAREQASKSGGCNCGHCHNSAPVTQPLSDIGTRIINIICEQLSVDKDRLTLDTKPFDLGADSLDGVELTMAFEEEFGIEIPDLEAEKYDDSTIGEIIKGMETALGQGTQTPAPTVAPAAPTPTQYDIGVADGKKQRAIHRGTNTFNPKYLPDDVNGSDSQAHADYIRGYVFGYNQ